MRLTSFGDTRENLARSSAPRENNASAFVWRWNLTLRRYVKPGGTVYESNDLREYLANGIQPHGMEGRPFKLIDLTTGEEVVLMR